MLERDTRQIALVWFCLVAAVLIMMAGRSAVLRYRQLLRGQLLYGEVVQTADRYDPDYRLVHQAAGGGELEYVMPYHNMFIRHQRKDVIAFIALPESPFVQPASHLEYWLARLEVKACWIPLALAVVAFGRGRRTEPEPGGSEAAT